MTTAPLTALINPQQLGFVDAAVFPQIEAAVSREVVAHLGTAAGPQKWIVTLRDIYPVSTFTSTARFVVTKRPRVTTDAGLDADQRLVRVNFNRHTGEVQSRAIDLHPGAIEPVESNVHLRGTITAEIERQADELVLQMQGGEYTFPGQAERARNHRRLRFGRSYSAANRSTIWVEVGFRVLLENRAGGLHSHDLNLVYVISPNQHVHLGAADDPGARAFIAADASS